MTGNDYQKLAARTINKGLTFEEQKNHALHGMVGEENVPDNLVRKCKKGVERNDQIRKCGSGESGADGVYYSGYEKSDELMGEE